MSTIKDLKYVLGIGLGLQRNKYLIEIPLDNYQSRSLNILCKAAGFPVRNMPQAEVWRKGRKFNMRSETDYGGTYEITILDDSGMMHRQLFDRWMKAADNSKPVEARTSGGSFEDAIEGTLDEINSAIIAGKMVKNVIKNPGAIADIFLNVLEGDMTAPLYQTDINIWQLNGNNEKVYGYKIQNACPTNIGNIEFSDETQNSLSEFTVTFAFSEFEPIYNATYAERAANYVLGEETVDTIEHVGTLFE